jgi:hypothetical protein
MINTAMDIILDRFNNLKISGTKEKHGQQKHPTKKLLQKNLITLTAKEYQVIAKRINKQYVNRNKKPFTWKFIKNIVSKSNNQI